jgi:AraC-like DNA-binding protein
LEALGKQVGCSPFYLSRIFSQQMGTTISQYLRQLRMEKAAALLRAGKMNVTEVAMEVGYSSSSHFSVAFHETFGCCPDFIRWRLQRSVRDGELSHIEAIATSTQRRKDAETQGANASFRTVVHS